MAGNYCYWCMQELEDKTYLYCPHCGNTIAITSPNHQLRPGTVLNGEYMVGRALGEGGFGITYLGRDLVLGNRVAIKEYFPSGMSTRDHNFTSQVTLTKTDSRDPYEQGRKNFLKEARTLARFDTQPGIVRVRRFFEANNTAYLVMDYVEGVTLKEYVKTHGPIKSEILFPMFRPIIDALGEIHASNMIHRDISPDNIMMMPDGSLCLLDFGLAKDLTSEKSTSIKLKVGYAPEEQYQGVNQGPWTDVYALCATLYYCLTGNKPDDPITRRSNQPDSLVPPSAQGVSIRRQEEEALLGGLAVDRRNRFQSMKELAAALYTENRSPEPEPKPEPNPDPDRTPKPDPDRTPKPATPKWLIPAIAAAELLVIIGVLAATGVFKHQHVWGEWVTVIAPDCEHAGVEMRTCTKDGTHIEKRELSPLDHDWGDWVVQTNPGCETQGVEVRVCRLDASHMEMRSIPATGHDWQPATFTSPETCSICGATQGSPLKNDSSQNTSTQSVGSTATGLQAPGPNVMAGHADIQAPQSSSWLSAKELRYAYAPHGAAVYLYSGPGRDYDKVNGEYGVTDGTELTLLALENGMYLVKTSSGLLGWIGSNGVIETRLIDTMPLLTGSYWVYTKGSGDAYTYACKFSSTKELVGFRLSDGRRVTWSCRSAGRVLVFDDMKFLWDGEKFAYETQAFLRIDENQTFDQYS